MLLCCCFFCTIDNCYIFHRRYGKYSSLHLNPISPIPCHLSPLTYSLTPLTSHLSCLTSHVSPLMSHVSPPIYHLSLLMSPLFKCLNAFIFYDFTPFRVIFGGIDVTPQFRWFVFFLVFSMAAVFFDALLPLFSLPVLVLLYVSYHSNIVYYRAFVPLREGISNMLNGRI